MARRLNDYHVHGNNHKLKTGGKEQGEQRALSDERILILFRYSYWRATGGWLARYVGSLVLIYIARDDL